METEFQDQTIKCILCGDDFIWSAGEQSFFKELALDPPKRCPSCRRYLQRQRQKREAMKREEVQNGHQ